MTPDRRLDQLEPLMADSLQKIDRLIEGQGQIIEIATRADQKADMTAKGIAELTVLTQKQFDELRVGQNEIRLKQESFDTNLGDFRASLDELKINQEELKVTQEKLMTGQELILQILREKLP
ncbi:hypothetical protein [Spirosoma validum]|uniref:hypothetical protein n=1 Tax=Spirosoma validum TaxID=2771355 RepID=UPI001CC32610|nr:hypothetical protein [Spirosoma validum]